MAIIEAAAVGLLAVSTAVGGVPEVLPADLLVLAEPTVPSLLSALDAAVGKAAARQHSPKGLAKIRGEQHGRVSGMYSWQDVGFRIETVYDTITGHSPAQPQRDDSALARLGRFLRCGAVAGKIFCCVAAADHLYLRYLQWLEPDDGVEVAPDAHGPLASAPLPPPKRRRVDT